MVQEKKTQIRPLSGQEIAEIYQKHLVKDFPAGEVKPLSTILQRFEGGQYFAYGLFDESVLAGYAFFMNIRPQPVYLLDYFAIVEEMRSGGYGSVFLKELKDVSEREGRQLILEVENPDYETDAAHREMMKRRIAFYERNGMRVSNVTCNFYDNEYRILYAGAPLAEREVYEKTMCAYVDFFGEEFIAEHVVFHQ